jgi:hypothetical protein
MYTLVSVGGGAYMTNLDKKDYKRWGKEFNDERIWPIYNEQLVKRGEFFLEFDWVQNWNNELIEMNRNKIGRPYEFPNPLIRLQSIWHDLNIPFRMVEDITRQLCYMTQIPSYNDYSTINRACLNNPVDNMPID